MSAATGRGGERLVFWKACISFVAPLGDIFLLLLNFISGNRRTLLGTDSQNLQDSGSIEYFRTEDLLLKI